MVLERYREMAARLRAAGEDAGMAIWHLSE